MCRSRSPRRSASSAAASSTKPTGALRDMVPNHVFQLLAMTAMEPPNSFDAERGAHREGQGARGDARRCRRAGRGARPVRRRARCAASPSSAYRAEPNVAPDSIDRDLRRDAARDRQLALGRRAVLSAHRQVHGAPHDRDRDPVQAGAVCAVRRDTPVASLRPNLLVLQIQPDEGISLQFEAKRAGPGDGPRRGARWISATPTSSRRSRTPATRRCSTT